MPRAGAFTSFNEPGKEEHLPTDELMEQSEQTRSFLEAALSATRPKKQIANIGILDCDKICSLKLDFMLRNNKFAKRYHKGGWLSFVSTAI